jgi:nickel-dependent lactate racemase
MTRVAIPYGETQIDVEIPHNRLLCVAEPRAVPASPDPEQEIRRALDHPIGSARLTQAASEAQNVVILADDLTRQTPVDRIIPFLLEELHRAGLRDEQISVVIALGTHRPMTPVEIEQRFGREVTRRVRVINNPWQEPAQMVDLPGTPDGIPVSVSRGVLEAGFLIGLGTIVPHHIPGYSGGGKIVQPGVCGPATTGATHYLSTRAPLSYLGQPENPVRAEIDRIAAQVGLKSILNVVLNARGKLVQAFYGHPILAHRAGVAAAQAIYGVSIPEQAEIVLAGSHPCDIEFWQAHKTLYPAELAVKAGGTIIVVTPCPEGVSVVHQDMLTITAMESGRIQSAMQAGQISDIVSGALALAWAKVRERAPVSLVSQGIRPEEAAALGFTPYASAQDALDAALRRHGPLARVTVLPQAPESLPLQG